jgi:hypothetical protein
MEIKGDVWTSIGISISRYVHFSNMTMQEALLSTTCIKPDAGP